MRDLAGKLGHLLRGQPCRLLQDVRERVKEGGKEFRQIRHLLDVLRDGHQFAFKLGEIEVIPARLAAQVVDLRLLVRVFVVQLGGGLLIQLTPPKIAQTQPREVAAPTGFDGYTISYEADHLLA